MRRILKEAREAGLDMKEVQKIIKEKSAGQGMDVTQADFLESVRKVSPSVNEDDLKRYEKCESEWREQSCLNSHFFIAVAI